MKLIFKRFVLILFVLITTTVSFAQRPEDGHINHRKWGVMDGNLTRIPFWTDGRIGRNVGIMGYYMEFPIGSGHQQMDGIAPVVVTKITDVNGVTYACCETGYSNGDMDPTGNARWRYESLGGYCNPNQLESAMSDDPYTWPNTWPDRMDDAIDPGWHGNWNGYFGKGVMNADLETYHVIDDDPDEEFEFFPDATDHTRRGLGTQIYIRSLQWRNIMTETHNFWLYEVENEGTTDYDSVYFALYADFKIGGDDEDVAGYNTRLDIAYCYDYANVGLPGNYSPVPVTCYGFLESPTLDYDGIDTDEDGLIDEKRDSGPGSWIFGPTGYYDHGKLDEARQETMGSFYESWHWSGDEDGDWDAFEDKNGNGTWDFGEPLNDDLGADGIGPFDEAYTARDPGEGDGIPTAGEPDFDEKDLDEGDQLGLTGFWSGAHSDRSDHSDDEKVLSWCSESVGFGADEYLYSDNLGVWFHSGPVYFPAKTRNRFSFSLFFAEGPTSKEQLEDAVRKKETVQKIYNANYSFAQPPKVPNLKAVAGDGKVYLYWDDSAENSYDRFFGTYDFQGYSLYRSTDPTFQDCHIITDAYGVKTMNKPIFRCDKKDSISGFFPGIYNGIHFDIGDNTGLVHSYVDSANIINGQTYYYALCSFDNGWIPAVPEGEEGSQEYLDRVLYESVLPSECSFNIKIDLLNDIKAHSPNCAIVTPTSKAAGYSTTNVDETVIHSGPQSTTEVEYEIFNPLEVTDATYRLEFSYPDSGWRSMPYYQLLDITDGSQIDTIQSLRQFNRLESETPYFNGLVVKINFDTTSEITYQGWQNGSQCELEAIISAEPTQAEKPVNLNFNIVFTEEISDSTFKTSRFARQTPVPFYVYCTTLEQRLDFIFIDGDGDRQWDRNEAIRLLVGPYRGVAPSSGTWNFQYTWRIDFNNVADTTDITWPQPGDVFEVRMAVPPQDNEMFQFSTTKPHIDRQKAKNELDRIAVVPNPYVVTELWEPSSPYLAGRGPMEIHFIHVPAECTIRVFTVQGYLVDTIEHRSEINDGTAVWDVMSKDNMHIAPGNYIYHVDAPGLGENVGRFVVIK